ncbi:RNA-dependent RNA polymerase family protein [Catenuloplanes japonicus]|uniref:hypothetical protein n=1 Tax=Catenuloplanes japonicus TaxID=33876 RepID=UPI0018DCFFBB|nr:hypothetical protein [Catenuloplanes japonicus]
MSDIAACYEYIVPQTLVDELFLRTDDYELVESLAKVLQELATLGRGIPQMLEASDHLADLYLSIVDRALDRANLRWVRTADDYKIVVTTWAEALAVLALLDKEVRAVGLILSANKTRIVAVGPKARTRSSSSPEPDSELENADEEEDDEPVDALLVWHKEWQAARKKNRIIDPPSARDIRILNSSDRVTSKLLADLVFAYPPHLEYVVGAIIRLADASADDDDLVKEATVMLLDQVPRTSWNILWLLELASRLAAMNRFDDLPGGRLLAEAGLNDSAELVRAQSAWYMAKFHSLTSAQLQSLHLRSSRLTIAGVSAAAALAAKKAKGRKGDALNQVAAAIRNRQPLNEAAVEWAESHA